MPIKQENKARYQVPQQLRQETQKQNNKKHQARRAG